MSKAFPTIKGPRFRLKEFMWKQWLKISLLKLLTTFYFVKVNVTSKAVKIIFENNNEKNICGHFLEICLETSSHIVNTR